MTPPSDTRERITLAAIELFHARSYDSVGVNDICERAGVVKGSFYHFFTSKDELVLAVIDAMEQQMRTMMQRVAPPTLPPLARIEALFRHLAACGRAMKKEHGGMLGCPFGNLAVGLSTRNEAIRQRLVHSYRNQQGFFESALREAQELGELDPQHDPAQLAVCLQAFMQGMGVMGKTFNDPDMLDHLVGQMLALLGVKQNV